MYVVIHHSQEFHEIPDHVAGNLIRRDVARAATLDEVCDHYNLMLRTPTNPGSYGESL